MALIAGQQFGSCSVCCHSSPITGSFTSLLNCPFSVVFRSRALSAATLSMSLVAPLSLVKVNFLHIAPNGINIHIDALYQLLDSWPLTMQRLESSI